VPAGDEPPWWTPQWQALADSAGDHDADSVPRATPVTPDALDALSTSKAILTVWPRLTDEQRDTVRRRVRSEGVLVAGELFVCLAVAMPETSWEPANPHIANLFGPSWTRGLTMSVDAVRTLVRNPWSLPGPWLEPIVEGRWSFVVESPLWEPMVTDVVHDAVVTDRITLDEATALHTRTCRDSDCVILDLRPDSPWERAGRHLAASSPFLRRLAVQHPGCPLEDRVAMLDDDSAEVARAAVLLPAPAEFDHALLAHTRFVLRKELGRLPDRALSALGNADVVGWERMAKWCRPSVSSRYRDAFMGHEAWKVRAAYVKAHHGDEPTAALAAADENPRVRAALASHTADTAVLSRLAHDDDARVRSAAARRVVSHMTQA
jgi:hypothetical protein